jgi:hypothetical protein
MDGGYGQGYRRYVKIEKDSTSINFEKLKAEARFDGEWILRTNTDLATAQVALKYGACPSRCSKCSSCYRFDFNCGPGGLSRILRENSGSSPKALALGVM